MILLKCLLRGFYYKFNEGTTGMGDTDNIVLDYAGGLLTGLGMELFLEL